jgi:tRNA G37 N-methylase Trm5
MTGLTEMKANRSNYKLLEQFLKKKDIEYHKLSEHQYRILGDVAIIDVWPARMTVHVIQTEAVDPNRYFRLDYNFNAKQLNAVLNGEEWK